MQRTNGRVKIVIAGGGTGGHVTPAIAVHEELKRRDIDAEFLWIGSTTGIEGREAARASIPFVSIQTGKFRRYIDIKTVPDFARLPVGFVQAANQLRRFKPDVVFSTGGFVSVPTVVAARLFAPAITHEQTATIGLANKINAKFVKTFAVSYESTAAAMAGRGQEIVVTGNPLRETIKNGDAARAREHFGFAADLPVIYVTGGARGASAINQRIMALLPKLLEHAQIVHQTGDRAANPDYDLALAARDQLPERLQQRYAPREFIGPEIGDLYALTSLVIGRGGAGTVAELGYFGLPSILIPLPGSGGNEQRHNADLLGQTGGAVVIEQSSATVERLHQETVALISDPVRLAAMAERARSIGRSDAASRLADLILAHAKPRH